MSQLEQMFANFDAELDSLEKQRASKLNNIKEKIQSSMLKIKKACDLSTLVTQMGSFFDITSMYSHLSEVLEDVSQTAIPTADEKLGEIHTPKLAKLKYPEQQLSEKWKLLKWFSTLPGLKNPQGIAVNKDGKIALTDHHRRAGIVTKNGNHEVTLQGPFNMWLYDIAVTANNLYILPSSYEIAFYDNQGVQTKPFRIRTRNHKGSPALVKTLAVDSNGKIIAGLETKSIAI